MPVTSRSRVWKWLTWARDARFIHGTPMNPPLLLFEDARIDVDGVPLVEQLNLKSSAERIGLVGDWSPLFALLGARAELVRGRAEVLGVPAERAVASGQAGLALAESEWPESNTVEGYLAASARLAGFGRGRASEVGRQALGELGLEPFAGRRIRDLDLLERRGLALAHAVLGSPRIVALEAPLSGLPEPSARVLTGWIERAVRGRALLISAPSLRLPGPERGFFDGLGELLVLGPGGLAWGGAPAEVLTGAQRYSLLVGGESTELVSYLREQGIETSVAGTYLLLELRTPEALDVVHDALVDRKIQVRELVPIASLPGREL